MSDEAARHYLRAELLSDLGRPERALAEAESAIAADPELAEGWFAAARAHVTEGAYEQALEHAEKGLALGESGWGHRVRSVALTGLGRHREALDAARFARALQPEEWRCYTRLARCHRNLYSDEDADSALREAVALAPSEPSVYAQWARVCFATGHFADAEARARKAVALAPEHVGALTALGAVLEDRDPTGSFAAYAQAFRLEPARVDIGEKVRELGMVLAVWPLHVATVLVIVALAAAVSVASWWPSMWCAVAVIGVLGASFLAATRRRGRRRLDAAITDGAALFATLRAHPPGR